MGSNIANTPIATAMAASGTAANSILHHGKWSKRQIFSKKLS